MIELALIVIGVTVVYYAARTGLRELKNRMDLNYNHRQFTIHERTCYLIFKKADETDTPREDTMILLNVAAEVYNESLRGKYVKELYMPPFHLMRQSSEIGRDSERRQTDSQGDKSEGETEDRTARQVVDSSGQG